MEASRTPFIVKNPPAQLAQKISITGQGALPVKSGRETQPDGVNTLGGFMSEMAFIEPDFPIHMLAALENLAKYHGDVSLAVENIVSLGNTPYNLEFDDAVSDADAKKMRARIKEKEKSWYAYSGGLYSLINDILAQIAIAGCLSVELVPTNSLDGVKKVVLVAPKNIRFKYNLEKDVYDPYQQLVGGVTSIAAGNMVQLNTATYKYSTLRRFSEKPYPIPPFLAAMFHLNVERDMMDNMRFIIKKLGVLGFLEVLINAPKPLATGAPETDAQYFDRSKAYLEQIVPEIEKGMAKGYVTGFKDKHEFTMHSTAANVQGAKELVDMNDQKMMSGLKQDPLMFGRNFSTTETLGRVILAKMTAQISNYQMLAGNLLSELFLLDLQLGGFSVKSVDVTFEKAMIGDKSKEEEAFSKRIDNANKLYDAGIISQTERANYLSYEKADQEEPRTVAPVLGGADSKDPNEATNPSPKNTDATDPKSTAANIKIEKFIKAFEAAGGNFPQYEYESAGCTCTNHCATSFEKGSINSVINDYVEAYASESLKRYTKASKALTRTIGEKLLLLNSGVSEQAVIDVILYSLYKDFNVVYTKEMAGTISKFVNESYAFFRKNKTMFKNPDKVPNGAFNSIDYRAIDYYKNSDTFYLGKFITDEDLKSSITKYVKEEYLTRNLPIGNNTKGLEAFKEKFGDIMQGQDWKIRRIIDTTVNKMRNTAAVNYMTQAKVEEFEIVGVSDRLQCAYCKNMQGKTFSVSKAVDTISSMLKVAPELVGSESPFITAIYKKPDDMKDLSGEDLQLAGVTVPPFHCHCRDQVIAKN